MIWMTRRKVREFNSGFLSIFSKTIISNGDSMPKRGLE